MEASLSVLATPITSAYVMENQPMRDLPWRVRFRRNLWPRQVTGDANYGTMGKIGGVEDLSDLDLIRRIFIRQMRFAHDVRARSSLVGIAAGGPRRWHQHVTIALRCPKKIA